ncbi:type II toxin-antitoxin system death-on-curing family toxin [Spirosoma sp. KNUC1025]|uniref:type II toxin-antitoxin system death-on-curing family toxin n=1 Tax=Spirosoma sp. KNUC1025 TaxID=2894082 RepID=UPI003865C653|nr:type II toxin-antitoxin system death-on-curing family toxin [Spirosoma sp. KNUC1025]
MIYLTKAEVIAINHNQVHLFGGNFVHEENLDYLLEAVQAEMFGEPLYPEIHQITDVYLFNIISNHIFQDGNKRTGLQAATIFLQLNRFDFNASVTDEILINFTLAVASAEHTLEIMQDWFMDHLQTVV